MAKAKPAKVRIDLDEADADWLLDLMLERMGWDRDPERPETRIIRELAGEED